VGQIQRPSPGQRARIARLECEHDPNLLIRVGGYDQAIVRKGFVPVVVALACLLLAACGSSGSGGTVRVVHTPPATKATFAVALGSLCQKANNAFGVAKGNKDQVSVISHYLIVFRSLNVPANEKSLYDQYLGVLQQELAALKSGDSNKLFTLAHTKARPLAQQLGAKGCIT
jgi:hypothetical protein